MRDYRAEFDGRVAFIRELLASSGAKGIVFGNSAGSEGRLVAGTGNRSEAYMGYFTKWGDGAYDFNPIADLTATEVIEFLDFLDAPESIRTKAPSAGLYEGQTDEQEMGVTYAAIDRFLETGEAEPEDLAVIERFHARSEHKRRPAATYQP